MYVRGLLPRRAGPQTGPLSLQLTATLLKHLVRPQEQSQRNRRPERLRSFHVDHRLELQTSSFCPPSTRMDRGQSFPSRVSTTLFR